MAYIAKDLTGEQFGLLTVIDKAEPVYASDGKIMPRWHCKCICGNELNILASKMRTDGNMSCGCTVFNEEKQGELGKHLYDIYKQMVHRCYAKKYKDYQNYGGRGIKICKEWFDKTYDYIPSNGRFKFSDDRYHKFYVWGIEHGYTPGLTLDRIDNDKDYSPNNCRWADAKTQANNRRTNRRVPFNGVEYTISELAQKAKMSPEALTYRLDHGMCLEVAINKPLNHNPGKRFYTVNGETHNIAEWSRISNVPPSTITRRINEGWNPKDAIFTLPDSRYVNKKEKTKCTK